MLYEKGLLVLCNPETLSNTLWLNNTLYFGLRGCKVHRDMRWGGGVRVKMADGRAFGAP